MPYDLFLPNSQNRKYYDHLDRAMSQPEMEHLGSGHNSVRLPVGQGMVCASGLLLWS